MHVFFRIKLLCQFMRIEYLSHMGYPKEISILLPLMTQMFSDDIHLGYTIGLIFSLGLHLNPYVLCEISIGSADESMLFGNKLV